MLSYRRLSIASCYPVLVLLHVYGTSNSWFSHYIDCVALQTSIKDLYIHILESDLSKSAVDEEELSKSRIQRRVYELLSKAASSQPSHPSTGQRELHFVFFRRPERFLHLDDNSGQVKGVRLEKTILKENDGSGRQSAVGTGKFEDLDCGLLLKSIGYKSVPVNGVPFDPRKGVVPNIRGKVLSNTSEEPAVLENGLYVVGWLKRGPTGIVATNLHCAEETVASILEDLNNGVLTHTLPKLGREGLQQLLESRGVEFMPYGGWEKIDLAEKTMGSLRNKPREKITRWEELLKAAKG